MCDGLVVDAQGHGVISAKIPSAFTLRRRPTPDKPEVLLETSSDPNSFLNLRVANLRVANLRVANLGVLQNRVLSGTETAFTTAAAVSLSSWLSRRMARASSMRTLTSQLRKA